MAYDGGAGAEALETAGWAAFYRRDLAGAERYADAGIRLGRGADRVACLALGGEVRHSNGNLAAAEVQLEEALSTANSDAAAFAPAVLLASVLRHQGHPREALELLGRPSTGHPLSLQLVPMTAQMVAVHTLGMLGEAAAALEQIREWEEAMERQGASRFKGRPANFKAWVLRALGLFDQAEELNLRALDEARGLGTGEAEAHAFLDLADGELRLGRQDSAARYLDNAAPLQERQHANRWRHELRYRLLRSRLSMAVGRTEEAYTSASRLQRDARQMGARRYADLAFVQQVKAAAALGMPVEYETLDAVLTRLPEHSGLEAWWLTADVAAATRTDRFWTLAEAHADCLAAHAGEHGQTFRHYAGVRLAESRGVALHT